jgi:hypothetical protein
MQRMIRIAEVVPPTTTAVDKGGDPEDSVVIGATLLNERDFDPLDDLRQSFLMIAHRRATFSTTAAAAAPTRFQFESISSRAVDATRLASSHAAMSGLR